MDRIINVKVGGNHLSKDNKNAGVKGEGNVTKLRITFDEGWDGYAKTVTFFDALGGNPVKRIETVDLIEDITTDARTYITPIPQEPLAIAGEMTFVIDGYLDGKRQRSIADKLVVKDAPNTDTAGEPTDPTPTEPEQWQAQIEKIKDDIQQVAISKEETAGYAEEAEQFSKDSQVYSEIAQGHSTEALGYKRRTEALVQGAILAANKAEEATTRNPIIVDGNWHVWNATNEVYVDTGVKAQSGSTVWHGDNPPDDADVWIDPEGESAYNEIKNYIDEQTEILKSDVAGLQAQINEEAHFRGYLSTNAKIQALKATPNDFAYSSESGTKWVYDAESGWIDTGSPVPDQLTPASDTTPLINGVASVGQENAYARGDHRHPTDTTKEDKANKVTDLADGNNITDEKYPSAKAVMDCLDAWITPVETTAEYANYSAIQAHNKINEDIPKTYENKSNKTTVLSANSTDNQYPSAKAVFDAIEKHGDFELIESVTLEEDVMSVTPTIVGKYKELFVFFKISNAPTVGGTKGRWMVYTQNQWGTGLSHTIYNHGNWFVPEYTSGGWGTAFHIKLFGNICRTDMWLNSNYMWDGAYAMPYNTSTYSGTTAPGVKLYTDYIGALKIDFTSPANTAEENMRYLPSGTTYEIWGVKA